MSNVIQCRGRVAAAASATYRCISASEYYASQLLIRVELRSTVGFCSSYQEVLEIYVNSIVYLTKTWTQKRSFDKIFS